MPYDIIFKVYKPYLYSIFIRNICFFVNIVRMHFICLVFLTHRLKISYEYRCVFSKFSCLFFVNIPVLIWMLARLILESISYDVTVTAVVKPRLWRRYTFYIWYQTSLSLTLLTINISNIEVKNFRSCYKKKYTVKGFSFLKYFKQKSNSGFF